MKKVVSVFCVLILVFCTTVFVFADDSSRELPNRSTVTRYTDYDSHGNTYKITGKTSAELRYGMARTNYSINTYGQGLQSSVYGIKLTVGTSTTVMFSDATTNNTISLTGHADFTPSSSNINQTRSNSFIINSSFTGVVASVNCRHYFETDAGNRANISFNSYAYPPEL